MYLFFYMALVTPMGKHLSILYGRVPCMKHRSVSPPVILPNPREEFPLWILTYHTLPKTI